MSIRKNKLENLIRDYLLEEGILRDKISRSDFDFGFAFSYPPGPQSQTMSVFKPKNKNCIYIAIQVQISDKHINALKSLKDNRIFQFFHNMRKYFLIKEVYFKINTQIFRYEILEQFYIEKEEDISKNILFKGIQKVFYCFVFSNLLLEEYCSGKEILSSDFDSEFDLSLYS